MKKMLFTLCFILSSMMVMAQMGSYKIKGQLPKSMNGDVSLIVSSDRGSVVINSATMKEGAFQFKGEVPDIVVAYLVPKDQSAIWATLFLGQGSEHVIGTDAAGMITVSGGGVHQDIYGEFEAVNRTVTKIQQQCMLKAQTTTDEAQLKALQNMLGDAIDKARVEELEILKKHNDTFAAAYYVYSNMMSVDENTLIERCLILGPNAQTTMYGEQIGIHLTNLEKIAIDAVAPDFSAALADGGAVKLSELEAKVKIVYFWSSWSAESRDKMSILVNLYKHYRPKGLDIIGVSLDENKQAWLKAIGEDGASWKNIMDIKDGQYMVSPSYCVTTLPCIFVLNENNKIVAKNIYGDELKAKIDEMFRKK